MVLRRTLLGLALVVIPGPAPPAAVTYAGPLAGRLQVVRAFDPPTSSYGAGHRGVDLAARPGTVIMAAAAGVVEFAGPLAGRTVVSVRHDDGIRTTYEPLATLDVVRGQRVAGGALLGTLAAGHPGCLATGGEVCLHWGALRGADYLDPLTLLDTGDIVLLPPVATRVRSTVDVAQVVDDSCRRYRPNSSTVRCAPVAAQTRPRPLLPAETGE